MKCPWHGFEYAPRRLAKGQGGLTTCGARLELRNGRIEIGRAKTDVLV